jgi:hypothetical protein
VIVTDTAPTPSAAAQVPAPGTIAASMKQRARKAAIPATLGRGGPGRGQGRKRLPLEDRLLGKSIRLTAAQWQTFDQLGAAPWLRVALDAMPALERGAGAPAGPGRRATEADDRLLGKSIRLTAGQWHRFDLVGGVTWLRATLDAVAPR